MSWKTRSWYIDDFCKTCLEDIFKTSWRTTNICWNISLSNTLISVNLSIDWRPATLLVKELQRNLILNLQNRNLVEPMRKTSEMESVFSGIARIDSRVYWKKASTKEVFQQGLTWAPFLVKLQLYYENLGTL